VIDAVPLIHRIKRLFVILLLAARGHAQRAHPATWDAVSAANRIGLFTSSCIELFQSAELMNQ
jgi:hypothetical protein